MSVSSSRQPGTQRRRGGFTLLELLVVIGIIVILIGILIPVISHVRKAAHAASTQSLIAELQGAIERYHMDFRAYPGPLQSDVMYQPVGLINPTDPDPVIRQRLIRPLAPLPTFPGRVTGSENLVLGLLGGLEFTENTATVDPSDGFYPADQSQIRFNPSLIGTGPRNLGYDFANGVKTAKTNQAKSAYLESVADLSTNSVNNDHDAPGHYKDGVGEADDSIIPEFVDRFSSPMPILYLRARVGGRGYPAGATPADRDGVVTTDGICRDATNAVLGPSQYGLTDIRGYTESFTGTWAAGTIGVTTNLDAGGYPTDGAAIGEGKSIEYWYGANPPASGPGPYEVESPASGRTAHHGLRGFGPAALAGVGGAADIPYNATAYLTNTAIAGQPRGKDTYILISAGPDRVYGTADDITSFGPVMP